MSDKSVSGETARRTRTRRWFPQDYKDQAVAWYFAAGKPVAQVADELNLPESTLRAWIRRATRTAVDAFAPTSETALAEVGETEPETAWHGEPEEVDLAAVLHDETAAAWLRHPAGLETLFGAGPAIAEVAYRLGVSESVMRDWVRFAAAALEAVPVTAGNGGPAAGAVAIEPESTDASELAPAAVTEPERVVTSEPDPPAVEPQRMAAAEPESRAIPELETTATLEPQPTATAEPEPAAAGEPAVTAILEPEPTATSDAVLGTILEPEAATSVDAGDRVTPVGSEAGSDEAWTLEWRPPTDIQAGPSTEWVYVKGWTLSHARNAALALLGVRVADGETGVEVEFLQVPRRRLGGRVHARARRVSAG